MNQWTKNLQRMLCTYPHSRIVWESIITHEKRICRGNRRTKHARILELSQLSCQTDTLFALDFIEIFTDVILLLFNILVSMGTLKSALNNEVFPLLTKKKLINYCI